MPKKYKIKFEGDDISIKRESNDDGEKKLHGMIQRIDSQIKFVPNCIDTGFDEFFSLFSNEITDMCLSKKFTNKIFELCEKLIIANLNLTERFLEKSGKKCEYVVEALNTTQHYVLEKILSVKTSYRRDKQLETNHNYVAPVEKAMGLKWKTKISPELDLLDHQISQTTFQIVPIAETLKSLFSNSDFRSIFNEYNSKKHLCIENVYRDYCCGAVGQNDPFYRRRDTVVIQFGIDEVDLCCGLKSKATIHKVFAVYFRIRNMPIKYNSKLNNIFLAGLCSSSNFKQTGCGEDNVMDELRIQCAVLEEEGLNVGDSYFKVGVFDVACDNLGANVSFGFAGSFSAEFFCRFCVTTKTETHTMIHEDISKRRTISQYNEQLKKLKSNPNLSLKDTLGIHKNCLLNELKHFHVISHPSIDIMHDICEGVIPFFLTKFYSYCIENKISNEPDLIRRIRDFHYGQLNSRNKPSRLRLERPTLGQNAKQSFCIMIHLPFIFNDKKEQLQSVWLIMIALLECIRVLFSYTITENDIEQFETSRKKLMSGMLQIFGTTIKPKLHNFVHYAYVIRQMGPPRLMWMMRYESKHKFFTDAAKKTNNFINITKSLAETCQNYMSTKINSYCDDFEPSKKCYNISRDTNYQFYSTFLKEIREFDLNSCVVLNFLKINSNMYRKGFMIIFKKRISEIIYVLRSGSDYFLVCRLYDVVKFEASMNSFKIKKTDPETLQVLNMKELLIHSSFEKKNSQNSIFIIADSLEVFKELQ